MIDEKILIEKIKDHAEKVGDGITNPFMKSGYKLAHEHIVDIIHFIQTTSRPVVLCENCVHYDKGLFHAVCSRNKMYVKENDFCSFGQRKD